MTFLDRFGGSGGLLQTGADIYGSLAGAKNAKATAKAAKAAEQAANAAARRDATANAASAAKTKQLLIYGGAGLAALVVVGFVLRRK